MVVGAKGGRGRGIQSSSSLRKQRSAGVQELWNKLVTTRNRDCSGSNAFPPSFQCFLPQLSQRDLVGSQALTALGWMGLGLDFDVTSSQHCRSSIVHCPWQSIYRSTDSLYLRSYLAHSLIGSCTQSWCPALSDMRAI